MIYLNIFLLFFHLFYNKITSIEQQREEEREEREEERECSLYLAPSLIPGAVRGVFSGKKLYNGDLVDLSVSLVIPSDMISHWQLFNYVYSANAELFSMALFGAGMLYNHMNPKNLDNYWHETPPLDSETYRNIYSYPHTTYTNVEYIANREIQLGEELFASYGEGNDWFTARGIDITPISYYNNDNDNGNDNNNIPPVYKLEDLKQYGHCMTDIEVLNSTIPLAGLGIFATKSFKKGEIVTISPILVLPKHEVESTKLHSVLYNYCLTIPDTDITFFPIGLGGLINHGGKKSNVDINWFDWSTLNPSSSSSSSSLSSLSQKSNILHYSEILNRTGSELERCQFAPLDLQYIATRDIEKGEEILLNYGLNWENSWKKYLLAMESYLENYGDINLVIGPQFRHMIEINENIIPEHLKNLECIGSKGCTKNGKRDLSTIKNANKWIDKSKNILLKEFQEAKEFIQNNFINFNHENDNIVKKNEEL